MEMLTQYDLADKAQVSQGLICKLERYGARIEILFWHKVCVALNLVKNNLDVDGILTATSFKKESIGPKELGSYIKTHRKKLKMLQNQLAERAQLTQGTFSKIENGKHIPTLEQWLKITKLLNLQNNYIDIEGILTTEIPKEVKIVSSKNRKILEERSFTERT